MGPMARYRGSGLVYGINVHMPGLSSTMQVAPQGQTTAPSQYSLGKHFKSFQHETPLDAAGGRGLHTPCELSFGLKHLDGSMSQPRAASVETQ